MSHNPEREKYRRLLAQRGIPCLISGDKLQAVRDHVAGLHARGMTTVQIAERARCESSTVANLISGSRGPARGQVMSIRIDTFTSLMKVQFEESSTPLGARMDPTGTRRRLQALQADGFSLTLIAELLGQAKSSIGKMCKGDKAVHFVHFKTYQAVDETFRKLSGTRPEDYGQTAYQIGRAKGAARRNGFAPSHCWDEDTMDDPAALPEWTGECGTIEGALIHLRDNVPMCDRCATGRRKVDPYRLFEMFQQGNTSPFIVGRVFDIEKDQAARYMALLSAHKPRHILSNVNKFEMRGYCHGCEDIVDLRSRGRSGEVECAVRSRKQRADQRAKKKANG